MLDKTKGQKNLIAQSNRLTEARYNLSVGEQRLVLTILSFISPDDKDFKDYKISIWDLKKFLDLNTKSVYDQVKDALERLSKRSVKIDRKNGGYLISNWFSSAEYIPEDNSVYLSIEPKLKPYLLQLKEEFTRFNLFTIAHFRSTYTIRIYMLLKQYTSIGVREFDLLEFREILGIEENQYPRFDSLRSRVINQAKKDFEKQDENGLYASDITFDLETIRSGRKVSRLRFIIRKQASQAPLEFPLLQDNHDNPIIEGESLQIPTSPTLEKLQALGIGAKRAQEWLEKYGEDYLRGKIAYTEQQQAQGRIKNDTGAFLVAAVTENYQSDAETRQQEAKQAEAAQKAELKQQFMSCWRKLAETEYYRQKVTYLKDSLPDTVLDPLKEHVRQNFQGVTSEGSASFEALYHEQIKQNFIKPPNADTIEQIRQTLAPPDRDQLIKQLNPSVAQQIIPLIPEFTASQEVNHPEP